MNAATRRYLGAAGLLTCVLLAGCAGPRLGSPAIERIQTPPAPADGDHPAPERDRFALDAPIPEDSAVTIGRLANGLAYYVRANAKPANRASLRLIVDAGSTAEDESQLGLAHFVEHMAFNGTENFAKQELVDYLESIGMQFGADVNAYTSFDETVYMLEVPTDDAEALTTAFQILEDWAHRISFDPVEIDKERGVMVEEWRLGRGAAGRIRDRQLPVTFHGSRYAERLPIGKKEILESAPAKALKRFYADWYRPDRMAVVVVGDIDANQTVERITRRFGAIETPEEPRSLEWFPIPDHSETLAAIVQDQEATSINVTVGFKRPAERTRTVGELRLRLVDSLYHGMMNARLYELAQEADPPFVYGFAGATPLGRTKSMYRLSTGVREGGIERGLTTLLNEAKRVAEHGFLKTELERAKANTLRSIDRAWQERDKWESSRYVGGYTRNFLEQAPIPGIGFVRDLYHEFIPGIEISEINARADQWITENNRVILISGPDSDEAGIPEEAEVLDILAATEEVNLEPWIDRTREQPLVAAPPTRGRIVSEESFPEVGATLWKLSNGIEVLLKPTDFKNDEVLIRGYSPGGHSLVEDADYFSAARADTIVARMGLGEFDSIELGKALTGKIARASAFIGELSEGITASASPADLETALQLVHLRFTGARRDPEAFDSYLSTLSARLENQEASPGFWFSKKWNEVAFAGHPRRRLLTTKTLGEIDLDRSLEIYRDRFADASDFVFAVVGSFETEDLRPLVETWLASLPTLDREESFRDVEAYAQPGVSRFEVRKGLEPKTTVRIRFHGFADWNPLQAHLAGATAEALRIRLREIMREDLGGVYGVRVSSSLRRFPAGRYNSSISFSCDPERKTELLEAAFAELEKLKNEGPDQELVEKIRETQRRSRETALEQNRFWLAALHFQQVNQLPLGEILEYDEKIDAVTGESVRQAAVRYFDSSSYILGVLQSETTTTAAAPSAATP